MGNLSWALAPLASSRLDLPAGVIAITVKVRHAKKATLLMTTENAAQAMAGTEYGHRKMDFGDLVHQLASLFGEAMRNRDDALLKSVGIGALFSALYHPEFGAELRRKAHTQLSAAGRVHVLWSYDGAGALEVALTLDWAGIQASLTPPVAA